MEQIAAEIKSRSLEWYPERGEAKAVRIVGHTPKTDHYIYDLVVDFADGGSERLAAKVYRPSKTGVAAARRVAAAENAHLDSIWRIAHSRDLNGIPRPVGDFSAQGAVVSEKLVGIPLQSIIMKAALLPGYADLGLLKNAATASGRWLRSFQRITAHPPAPLNGEGLQLELEKLCQSCRGEGLDDGSIGKILAGTSAILERARNPLTSTAVLHDFTPLNVVVLEQGVGFSDFARLEEGGSMYTDPATFLAWVEALEKYPFCNHAITTEVQENFLDAYGAGAQEREILRVVKMKVLLSMFAAGRAVKESPARKKAMWANVMKKFIQTAAGRSLPDTAPDTADAA
jgi:hypothetical protein